MNNKKLSRLLEPNLKLYFLCLLIFSLAAITVSWPLALAALGLNLLLLRSCRRR